MATNKETLQDHEGRLKEIETQLGIKPLPPKKTTKERLTEWVKANPWLSLALPTILTVFTVFVGYWLNHHNEWWNRDVDARVGTVLEKSGGVQETLKQVRDTVNQTKTTLDDLKPFIHDVVTHQFENASKLRISTLRERVPAIQHLVALAQDQKIATDPKIVRTLGRNLLAVQIAGNGVSPWLVTNQLLGYYSTLIPFSDAGFIVWKIKNGNTECITDAGHAYKWILDGFLFENCTQHLDSILGPDPVSRGMVYKHLAFRNAKIIYSGGPLKLNTVYFINCTFELQSGKEGKQLAEVLLAQNPVKLNLP